MASATTFTRAFRRPIRFPTPLSSRTLATASQPSASGARLARNVAVTSLAIVSAAAFAVYYNDSRSSIHRYGFMPVIRLSLDPESAHRFSVKVLGSGLAPKDCGEDDKALEVELWGTKLSNPVGLAAGFDKDANAISGLFDLGFGWVELGSVTPNAQSGNPQPRVFHLPEDSAIINRYGFPSLGASLVLSRLRSYLSKYPSPSKQILAVNLGKNKSSAPDSISDFISGVRTFGPIADVLVINVSSPNTPGLRGLQGRGMVEELLNAVVQERNALKPRSDSRMKWAQPKIVLKIAPDLSDKELAPIAAAIRESGIDGVIVSNTTVKRPAGLKSAYSKETGGLSGPPLLPFSLRTLLTLRTLLPASIPLIGCGGISSGHDALQYAQAGATCVQLYTSFAYGGPGVPRRVKDELAEELNILGKSWKEVTQEAINTLSWKEEDSEEMLRAQTEALKAEALQLLEILRRLEGGENVANV